ncbi:hypothetical protein FJU44_04075 [Acinetobacter baumannii]|nr:hypothetical protein F6W73_07835 [Acinetobacter baumannii]TQF25088.1 hypothetical protein FJU44_04075 [Acinetobacter baumannii]
MYRFKVETSAIQAKIYGLKTYKFFVALLNSMLRHTLKFGEISKDDYSAGERFKKRVIIDS